MKILEFLGFVFISIIGTILHFTYDISSQNKYIGFFSAINESVWEHMKLVVFPSLVWLLIEIPFLGNTPNFILAKTTSLITMLVSIPLLYYLLKKLKKESLILDILIFYISIGVGQYISYKILNIPNKLSILNYISLIILIIIYIYFLIATYFPGKTPIFKNNKK